ncbi:MAG: DUF4277 domain-containing protein [Gammaproteobacteria bacterium]
MLPQDSERRRVSVGQAVKAMVLNGLGIVSTIPKRVSMRRCWPL